MPNFTSPLNISLNAVSYVYSVALDTDRVLHLYADDVTGIMGQIEDKAGNLGARVQVLTFSAAHVCGALLSADKVFVFGGSTGGSSGATIVTTSGLTLSATASTASPLSSMSSPDIVALDSTKVAIRARQSATHKLLIATISGTTITFGTAVNIDSANNGSARGIEKLNANALFVMHIDASLNLNLRYYTISGTVPTSVFAAVIDNAPGSAAVTGLSMVSGNRLAVILFDTVSAYETRMHIVNVATPGTSLPVLTTTQIFTDANNLSSVSMILRDTDILSVVHSTDQAAKMQLKDVVVNANSSLTVGVASTVSATLFTTSQPAALAKRDKNNLSIFFRNNADNIAKSIKATYNSPPNTPTITSPSGTAGSPANFSPTGTMSATYSDPDLDPMASAEIDGDETNAGGTPTVVGAIAISYSQVVASGGNSTRQFLPGQLSANKYYRFRTRQTDNQGNVSAWSPYTYIRTLIKYNLVLGAPATTTNLQALTVSPQALPFSQLVMIEQDFAISAQTVTVNLYATSGPASDYQVYINGMSGTLIATDGLVYTYEAEGVNSQNITLKVFGKNSAVLDNVLFAIS